MKRIALIIATYFILSNTLFAQDEHKITLVKTIPIGNLETVQVSLGGEIEILKYDGEHIKIETIISVVESDSIQYPHIILRRLHEVGRYSLQLKGNIITMPKLGRHVFIKGKQFTEELRFIIYKPHGIKILENSTQIL